MCQIEVLNMRPRQSGNVRAECGIRLTPQGLPGGILIQGIQVVEGSHGPFVSWPSWKDGMEWDAPRFPIVKLEDNQVRTSAAISILESYRNEVLHA